MNTVNVLRDLVGRYDWIDATDSDFAMAEVSKEGICRSEKRCNKDELHHRGDLKCDRAHIDRYSDPASRAFVIP
jgi:hypothetical protein